MKRKFIAVVTRARGGWARTLAGDAGDVPGWVLVAVMTAGLVTALWLVADDQLGALLGRAISSVGR